MNDESPLSGAFANLIHRHGEVSSDTIPPTSDVSR